MSRYTGPLCKKCRRVEMKLMLKGSKCQTPKCALDRRKSTPGQHGTGQMRKKMSVYAEHLREKQRVKHLYSLNEAQMRISFTRAEKEKGPSGDNFIILLERRLDNVVYRLGIAETRAQARQIVRHGKIKVDGKRISLPSYLVREGQEITLSDKMKTNVAVLKALEFSKSTVRPAYLSFEAEKLSGKMLRLPLRADVGSAINDQLIVEYYSR